MWRKRTGRCLTLQEEKTVRTMVVDEEANNRKIGRGGRRSDG